MKLGIMSSLYSYVGIPVEEYLESFVKKGIKYVDLVTIGDLDPRYLSNNKIDTLRRILEKLDLVPSCLIASVNGNGASSDKALMNRTAELIMQVIRVGSDLGFPMVFFPLGERETGIPPQQSWGYMKLFIEKCLDRAEKDKIILTFESNPRIYRMVNTINEVAQLLCEIPSPYLKATVDTGHMTLSREAPSEIRKLKGQIIHAHISDNDGTLDTNDPLGAGITPIPDILQELLLAGIEQTASHWGVQATAVIELGSSDRLILKNVEWVLDRSLDYLKKYASAYLK